MRQVFSCNQHKIKNLLPSLALALSLIITNTAFADYIPPSNPSRPRTATGSNSSRTDGCTGDSQTSLTALAPLAYLGRTVSLQPTFAWFVPNSPNRNVEFSLYEYTANGKSKVIYRTQIPSKAGIMSLSLPLDKASLSVGSQYLWQVALLCNPNHPSEDLLIRAEIEVVATPLNLKNALSKLKDPLKRSQIYAAKGLWYDALAETLNNSTNKTATLNLLTKLSKFEAEEAKKTTEESRQKELQEQSVKLQKIVSLER
ncbi:MAG: DUF928 domain-containing protein [Scytonema sp. PMC 1069.18]|nr:DUF928 domain-containing protein [Scytonema sp. PMC 1069.18]MEC4880473.1 DUF928 domain-containing protein [Scytonema sp. PMC 1070.18]